MRRSFVTQLLAALVSPPRLPHALLPCVLAPLALAPLLAACGDDDDGDPGPARAAGADRDCDPLDPAHCLLPFPTDLLTGRDAATDTGLRLDLEPSSVPANADGVPLDPARINRSDGFSPGQAILARVPGLDLHATWGVQDLPERERDHLADIARYRRPDAPIVVVDAETGARHPIFSELDRHPRTTDDERLLIVRPAVSFVPGRRYLVMLRDLRTADGAPIPAGPAFAALRDAYVAGEPAATLDAMRPGTHRVLAELVAAEPDVDVAALYLAWDFTVGSRRSLTGWTVHLRDEAFRALGDADLGDGVVAGAAPGFRVATVRDITQEERDAGDFNESNARIVEGFLEAPYFLDRAPRTDEGLLSGTRAVALPAFLNFTDGDGVERALPQRNPALPTVEVAFTCTVSVRASAARPSTPMVFGHGALSSRQDVVTSRSSDKRWNDFLTCGVDLWGFSDLDIPLVAATVGDLSGFSAIPDQVLQAAVHHWLLGRLLVHPEGFVADPAFQDADGAPLFRPEGLVYAGYSNGGTAGTMLTALAPDWRRAVLGVPGMNYLVILQRSTDWEGAVGGLFYGAYEGGLAAQLALSLVQIPWDRAEGNGFAPWATSDPLPNAPPHALYLLPALGDPNTPNLPAEILARTVGARLRVPSVAEGDHWSVDPAFGMDTIGDDPGDFPATGGDAYLTYVTSADRDVQIPPTTANVPNPNAGEGSPHGDPQRDGPVQAHAAHWLRTGEYLEPCGGAPCVSTEATRLEVPAD